MKIDYAELSASQRVAVNRAHYEYVKNGVLDTVTVFDINYEGLDLDVLLDQFDHGLFPTMH